MRYIHLFLFCFFCGCSTNQTPVKPNQVNHNQKSVLNPEFKALVQELNTLQKYALTDKTQSKSIKEFMESTQKRISELDEAIRAFKNRFETFFKPDRNPESLLSLVYVALMYQYYHDQIKKIRAPVQLDEVMKKRFTSEMAEMARLSLNSSHKAMALFTKKCEQLKSKEYCEWGVQDAINQLPILKK